MMKTLKALYFYWGNRLDYPVECPGRFLFGRSDRCTDILPCMIAEKQDREKLANRRAWMISAWIAAGCLSIRVYGLLYKMNHA